jgi:OFA family oxalate/formate antiporter-like MFS transporter
MMAGQTVGYPEGVVTTVIALCGLMNGGGRFFFAWWSDRLARRIDILVIILALSAGVMTVSFFPVMIALALLVVNACYGAGFSVIPAILADHYGMANISKIHGAVLSAWGVAGLTGNQVALLCQSYGGYAAVIALLVAVYAANIVNVIFLRRSALSARRAAADR